MRLLPDPAGFLCFLEVLPSPVLVIRKNSLKEKGLGIDKS